MNNDQRIMYVKLDEYDMKMLKEASELANEKYKIEGDFIEVEELFGVIETLMYAVDDWKFKYEELENDLEENYELKSFDPYDEYGISQSDFI